MTPGGLQSDPYHTIDRHRGNIVTLADGDCVGCTVPAPAVPPGQRGPRFAVPNPASHAVAGEAFEVVACRRFAFESGAGFARRPADSDAASVGMRREAGPAALAPAGWRPLIGDDRYGAQRVHSRPPDGRL